MKITDCLWGCIRSCYTIQQLCSSALASLQVRENRTWSRHRRPTFEWFHSGDDWLDNQDSRLVCCQAGCVRVVLADPEAYPRKSLTVVSWTFIILVLQDVNGRHSCNAVLENNSKLTWHPKEPGYYLAKTLQHWLAQRSFTICSNSSTLYSRQVLRDRKFFISQRRMIYEPQECHKGLFRRKRLERTRKQ